MNNVTMHPEIEQGLTQRYWQDKLWFADHPQEKHFVRKPIEEEDVYWVVATGRCPNKIVAARDGSHTPFLGSESLIGGTR